MISPDPKPQRHSEPSALPLVGSSAPPHTETTGVVEAAPEAAGSARPRAGARRELACILYPLLSSYPPGFSGSHRAQGERCENFSPPGGDGAQLDERHPPVLTADLCTLVLRPLLPSPHPQITLTSSLQALDVVGGGSLRRKGRGPWRFTHNEGRESEMGS